MVNAVQTPTPYQSMYSGKHTINKPASKPRAWMLRILKVRTTILLRNSQASKPVVRTFKIRSIHALGFEAGLFMVCLPLYMLWYGVGVWTALTMEVAILFFFLVYTFVFTLLFDQIFTRHTYEGS